MRSKILYGLFIAALFVIFVIFDYFRGHPYQWGGNIIQTIVVGGGVTLLNRLLADKWMWEPEED
ncbi:hypothetical protein IEO70_03975 [Bacillus sp. AGMB 02131]|uniref:Uncharacterized protein n=1 Tax=Peribacillus faecalis TaxID=2772559 RepID=A0A927HA31_9BACI|nr:hypothetical protein [Peribacillus faecalis]MBD3107514.1 hypothetical protein [Peribacillus faecalis]